MTRFATEKFRGILILIFSAFLLLHSATASNAQRSQCSCSKHPDWEAVCDTTHLKDGGLLYRQFNCERSWMEYRRQDGRRLKFPELSSAAELEQLLPLSYRLGYSLVREYPKHLLFRGGCPANGPCNYFLFRKWDGRLARKYESSLVAPQQDDETWTQDCLIYIHPRTGFVMLEWPISGRQYQLVLPRCVVMYGVNGDAGGAFRASILGAMLKIEWFDHCGEHSRFFKLSQYPAR